MTNQAQLTSWDDPAGQPADRLKDSFLAHFANEQKRSELARELLREKKKEDETINEIAERMSNQWRICDAANATPIHFKIDSFLNGIDQSIAYEVRRQGVDTWEEAVKFAKLHEQLLQTHKPKRTVGAIESDTTQDLIALVASLNAKVASLEQQRERPYEQRERSYESRREPEFDTRICWYCTKQGHIQKQCRQYQNDKRDGIYKPMYSAPRSSRFQSRSGKGPGRR